MLNLEGENASATFPGEEDGNARLSSVQHRIIMEDPGYHVSFTGSVYHSRGNKCIYSCLAKVEGILLSNRVNLKRDSPLSSSRCSVYTYVNGVCCKLTSI